VIGTVPVGLAQLTPDVEMLLQRATDALDDCFAIYRAVRDSKGTMVDFTVEHVNDAACRDAGSSREEQVGRMLGFVDPDYLGSELFAWHVQAVEAEGPSFLDEVFYERSAAGRRLRKAYEVRAVPLGAGRLAVISREITERKRREEELLLQSAVLNRAGEGICLVRATDGVIVYANPRFEQIYGYRSGELEGRHLSVLDWPGEHSARVGSPDQRGEASYEARHRRKDGTAVWCEVHTAYFDHPQHGPVWVAVHQDVTERMAAQDSLRESDQRMRTAIQAAPLMLYTMDPNLRYTWVCNNRIGLARDEDAVGHTDAELLGADFAGQVTRIHQLALAGKRVTTELKVELEDGPHSFDLAVGPLTNEEGEIVGLAGAAYDLSARARTRVAHGVSTPNVRR
jgi:PAS domain S-box-containing protein